MADRSETVTQCVIGAWYWLVRVPFAVQYVGRSKEHPGGESLQYFYEFRGNGETFLLHPTEHARADR